MARLQVESHVDSLSIPVMLTEPGTPLRFEGTNPSPTTQAQTSFSADVWGVPEAPLTTAGQEWATLEPKGLIKTLEPHLPSSLSVLIQKREVMTQCVVWGAARASMVMK